MRSKIACSAFTTKICGYCHGFRIQWKHLELLNEKNYEDKMTSMHASFTFTLEELW